jgi:hypothetical protein
MQQIITQQSILVWYCQCVGDVSPAELPAIIKHNTRRIDGFDDEKRIISPPQV